VNVPEFNMFQQSSISSKIGTPIAFLRARVRRETSSEEDEMDGRQLLIADDEFRRLRGKARRSRLVSLLTGRTDDLLSFEDVKQVMAPTGESYVGCKSVPVKRIVGSEGRVSDFNREFFPRRDFLHHRWCSVDSAFYDGVILPPVKLFEIGGLYFVRDGNHRVSSAKAHRIGYIDAEVTKLETNVRLHPSMTLEQIGQTANSETGGNEAA
jgi:hypothetical protein